jgi:hypothetical protein
MTDKNKNLIFYLCLELFPTHAIQDFLVRTAWAHHFTRLTYSYNSNKNVSPQWLSLITKTRIRGLDAFSGQPRSGGAGVRGHGATNVWGRGDWGRGREGSCSGLDLLVLHWVEICDCDVVVEVEGYHGGHQYRSCISGNLLRGSCGRVDSRGSCNLEPEG